MGRPPKQSTPQPPPSNDVAIIDAPAPAVITDDQKDKSFTATDNAPKSVDDLAAKYGDFTEAPVVPPVAEVKAKRGRPKGQTKVPPEQFVPKPETPLYAGALVSGALLLTIVDAFIPFLIATFHNRTKPHKIKAEDLMIPADVKKQLGVAADQVIQSANIKLNPTMVLLFSIVAAYGTAYYTADVAAKAKLKKEGNKDARKT